MDDLPQWLLGMTICRVQLTKIARMMNKNAFEFTIIMFVAFR